MAQGLNNLKVIKSQHSKNVKTFFKLEPERNVFFDFWNYKNDEKANKFLNFSLNKSKTILDIFEAMFNNFNPLTPPPQLFEVFLFSLTALLLLF